MRRALVTLLALACLAPATAHAASADVMVVGKSHLLRGAHSQRLKAVRVKVGHKRCTVAARTPLTLLARTGLKLKLRDYGACGRRARDAGSLYVAKVGPDRERGRDGWVYKLRRQVRGSSAGDSAARVRTGDRVLWFWCELGAHGCQRTLEVRPSQRSVAPGAPLAVTVTSYDDRGKGKPAPGATVALGSSRAVAGPDGVATLIAPAAVGRLNVVATRKGMVRSFGEAVGVG